MLTATGMAQLHSLGTLVRDRYVPALLNGSYLREEFHYRSTDYDRTLMSAQSLLSGLYPPGTGQLTADKLQPVPVSGAAVPGHGGVCVLDGSFFQPSLAGRCTP